MSDSGADESLPRPAAGGMPDLGSLLESAIAMQRQLMEAQARAGSQQVVGEAAGGKVRWTLTGSGDPVDCAIDPAVVDSTEIDLLEDLLVAALRDALGKVAALQTSAVQGATGGLGDLGGLGGLFGR
jgi:DNA-binding protein YbaB